MKDLRCIDPDVGKLIGHYETGNLKGGDRDRFEIHLINCTFCFNETFQTQPIITNLRVKAPAMITQLPRERTRAKAPLPARFFSLRNSRPWAGLVLLFLVALAVVCVYLERKDRRPHDLSPTGSLTDAPKELRWGPVAKPGPYEVSVLDDSKRVVWRKETRVPYLALPEEIRSRLRTGGRFVWQVEVPSSGAVAPIRKTAEFTIIPSAPSRVPLP